MLRFILSRLMMAIPTIVLVAVAVFALIRFIPGDPAALMLGDMAQPDQIAAMRVELGLDRSMPQQFLIWPAMYCEAISAARSSMTRRCCRWSFRAFW